MVKATRKVSKASKESKVLDVNSLSKIPALEKLLTSGNITIVLIYADWCGHCHTFKKNVWSPMCEKEAKHNRVAVNEKVLSQTSLANAAIDGYPSVVVVNEKGTPEVFQKPDGTPTNAMPTPQTPAEMEKVVNMPVTPVVTATAPPTTTPTITPPTGTPPLLPTAQGTVYTPSPLTIPPAAKEQTGGNLMQMLERMEGGALPTAVLKALSVVMGGGRRKRKTAKKAKRRFIRA